MMRRWIVVLAVLMGLGLVATQAAELDLGARAGYQRIADADDGSFLIGVFLRTDWRGVIFFEGAVLYNDEEVDAGGNTIDVEFIPIQFSAEIFVLGRDEVFCPYILAGGGAYVVRTTDTAASDSETQVDLGWHLGLGVDFVPTEKIFFEADLRYVWLDVEFDGQTVSDKLSDFNSWMATIGAGFRI